MSSIAQSKFISIWQRRLTRWQRQVSIGVVTFALILGFAWRSDLTMAGSAVSVPLPLSTQNADIIDANRRPVLLQGVNWFGMETDLNVPHGLWLRDYKEMLAQMQTAGL
ncbi:MAG: hypothetical protein HC895_11195 [Leptolyngbyaceae cyanobacterium SM1_3_5]|nr:hypothetical protein [Leptolyngbyaceae cyanobacterium SM1_3_5]